MDKVAAHHTIGPTMLRIDRRTGIAGLDDPD